MTEYVDMQELATDPRAVWAASSLAAGWRDGLLAFAAELEAAAKRPAHPQATDSQARYASGALQGAAFLARRWAEHPEESFPPESVPVWIAIASAATEEEHDTYGS